MHEESGNYCKSLDVRVTTQYKETTYKSKGETNKTDEDIQRTTSLTKAPPLAHATQQIPEPDDDQASIRRKSAIEKAATLGSLQAPPPKSINEKQKQKDSLLRPKTHQVRANGTS